MSPINETKMYDMLRRELKVLSAEGIYRVLEEKELSLQEFGKLQLEILGRRPCLLGASEG